MSQVREVVSDGGSSGAPARENAPADLPGVLAGGQVAVPACSRCGAFISPATSACPSCGSLDRTWLPSEGQGTIYTYTSAHSPVWTSTPPGFVVVVDLAVEGARMAGPYLAPGRPTIGAAVTGTSNVVDGHRVVGFRAAASEGAAP